jgi:hypothetical protein
LFGLTPELLGSLNKSFRCLFVQNWSRQPFSTLGLLPKIVWLAAHDQPHIFLVRFGLEAVAPIFAALIEVEPFLPEKPSQEHHARHPREYYSVDQRLGRRHLRLSSSEAMTAWYSRAPYDHAGVQSLRGPHDNQSQQEHLWLVPDIWKNSTRQW